MCLTIAYSKIKKRNLVLINNDTHQTFLPKRNLIRATHSTTLKAFTEVQFLSVFGRLFHSIEVQTVKVLSPVLFLVIG